MGLFGDQDANEVSDNPFYVAADVYQSVLTEFTLRSSKDGEKKGLSFQWTIEEEDSEYFHNTVSEWINVYISDEDAPDTQALRRDRARTKSRLTEIGMTPSEMNDLIDEDGIFNEDLASKFIGTVGFVEVTETKDKNFEENGKVYTNIKKVTLLESSGLRFL